MKTHYILSKVRYGTVRYGTVRYGTVRYQLSPEKQLAIGTCSIDEKIEGNTVYSLIMTSTKQPPPLSTQPHLRDNNET